MRVKIWDLESASLAAVPRPNYLPLFPSTHVWQQESPRLRYV
jgi:hypothetical protein